jgi:hypothetical protein
VAFNRCSCSCIAISALLNCVVVGCGTCIVCRWTLLCRAGWWWAATSKACESSSGRHDDALAALLYLSTATRAHNSAAPVLAHAHVCAGSSSMPVSWVVTTSLHRVLRRRRCGVLHCRSVDRRHDVCTAMCMKVRGVADGGSLSGSAPRWRVGARVDCHAGTRCDSREARVGVWSTARA